MVSGSNCKVIVAVSVLASSILIAVNLFFFYNRSLPIVGDRVMPVSKSNITSFSAEFKDCRPENWFGTTEFMDEKNIRDLDKHCGIVQSKNIHPNNPLLQRIEAIKNILQKESDERKNWNRFFESVAGNTQVDVFLGSYDRPNTLQNALKMFNYFVSGAQVHVFYDATSEVILEAYRKVVSNFPDVIPHRRSEFGGYFPAIMEVLKTTKSHCVMIASDDTTIMRPFDIRHHAAVLRMLHSGPKLPHRVSYQFRISYPAENFPNPVSFFSSPKAPYSLVEDCRARIVHLCYNRHIDGPMYLTDMLRKEWPLLNNPAHPGELEGQWMGYNSPELLTDIALYPADQLVVNSGMKYSTVRDDRKSSDSNPAQSSELRLKHAIAVNNGCYQEPEKYIYRFLISKNTHVDNLPMPWICPKGVETPADS